MVRHGASAQPVKNNSRQQRKISIKALFRRKAWTTSMLCHQHWQNAESLIRIQMGEQAASTRTCILTHINTLRGIWSENRAWSGCFESSSALTLQLVGPNPSLVQLPVGPSISQSGPVTALVSAWQLSTNICTYKSNTHINSVHHGK